jgi:hypothetical protein
VCSINAGMGCYGCRQGKKREGPNGAGKATKDEGMAGENLGGNKVVVKVCNAETRGGETVYGRLRSSGSGTAWSWDGPLRVLQRTGRRGGSRDGISNEALRRGSCARPPGPGSQHGFAFRIRIAVMWMVQTHVNGGDPGPADQHPPVVRLPVQRRSIAIGATVQGKTPAP